jgi:asparagine synthase (glutamine-hydrolysing)
LLGDFAYALCDVRQRRLLLVRDPLGVAPLYYHLSDDLCIVSDALDEMLAQPEIPRALDQGVVAEWCLNGHVHHQTDTFYAAIEKVPRATCLRLGAGPPKATTYWTVDAIAALPAADEHRYVDQLHDLLRSVIRDRLTETGTLGAHLSGGLDSTPIAILAGRACRAQGRAFYTYNWCQPDPGDARDCHEWTDARRVAQDEGFHHHETDLSIWRAGPCSAGAMECDHIGRAARIRAGNRRGCRSSA